MTEDLKATINLALKLVDSNPNAIIHRFHCFAPYPGTELYDVAVKCGFQPPKKLEDWASYNWDTANLSWLSDNDKKQLEAVSFCSGFVSTKGTDKKIKLLKQDYERVSNYLWPIMYIPQMLYRPIAMRRLKKFYFQHMMERELYRIYRIKDKLVGF